MSEGSPPGAVQEPQPRLRLPGNMAPFGYRDFSLFWTGLATTRFGKASSSSFNNRLICTSFLNSGCAACSP